MSSDFSLNIFRHIEYVRVVFERGSVTEYAVPYMYLASYDNT